MNEISLPTYEELDEALSKTSAKLHPSEAHGIICGMLCGKPKKQVSWEKIVTGGKESAHTHEILQVLYDKTKQQLVDFLFEFQLILPLDSEELINRAEALTLWCQGYLTGLKIAEIPVVNRQQSETTEAINDLIEIAKMNYEEVVDGEEDESAYVELVEYVRVAVILIYQEERGEKVGEKTVNSFYPIH